MALPTNALVNVQTYQKAELAYLLNSFCAIRMSNKKFSKFNEKTANLGDAVTFDLAPRQTTANGLVITMQDSTQRQMTLACTQAVNTTNAYSDQQFIFNVKDYMDRFGESAIKEIGSKMEADLFRNGVSGVRVNDPNNSNFGNLQTDSGPYRFYGNGVADINSYGQLAIALANFRDYGSSDRKVRGYLPMIKVPAIVNSGLSQFAMKRNDETALSWMLGSFSGCEWYESNLLPVHIAGVLGDTAGPTNNVLTVVSTNDPTGANITQITFNSPVISTSNAIRSGDLLQFNDGVSGKINLRYLTFIGHEVSGQSVQIRATADADTDGSGNITVSIFPALVSMSGKNTTNLNTALVAGMTATPLPSHRAGLIESGDQFYMAMPELPDQDPYTTVTTMDKESGASIRHYFGSQFGQNVRAYVRDVIWGSKLVPENSLRLIFPL